MKRKITYFLMSIVMVYVLTACVEEVKELNTDTAMEVEQEGNVVMVEEYENVKAIFKGELGDEIEVSIDGEDRTLVMKEQFDLKGYEKSEPITISYKITTEQVQDGEIKRSYLTKIDNTQ